MGWHLVSNPAAGEQVWMREDGVRVFFHRGRGVSASFVWTWSDPHGQRSYRYCETAEDSMRDADNNCPDAQSLMNEGLDAYIKNLIRSPLPHVEPRDALLRIKRLNEGPATAGETDDERGPNVEFEVGYRTSARRPVDAPEEASRWRLLRAWIRRTVGR